MTLVDRCVRRRSCIEEGQEGYTRALKAGLMRRRQGSELLLPFRLASRGKFADCDDHQAKKRGGIRMSKRATRMTVDARICWYVLSRWYQQRGGRRRPSIGFPLLRLSRQNDQNVWPLQMGEHHAGGQEHEPRDTALGWIVVPRCFAFRGEPPTVEAAVGNLFRHAVFDSGALFTFPRLAV